MQILHVTDGYLPRIGGIETHVHDLAHRQAADGHDVTLLTTTPAPPGTASAVTLLRPVDPAANVGTGMRHTAAFALTRPRDFPRADVVHAHASAVSPLAFAAIGRGSRLGVPTVVTVHSMLGTAAALRLAAVAFRWRSEAVEWTAVSESAARPLERALGTARPVSVLPNAVDTNAWRCPTRTPNAGQLTIVTVGRLARRKRPAALVRILRKVRAELPTDVRLRAVLVGDGPQRASLHALLDRHRMHNDVTLMGQADAATIKRIYRAADLYVAPAVLESFGIAALEARSSGMPVIAREGCGIGEFITHGVDGLFARDDAEMAEHIIHFATNPQFRTTLTRGSESGLPPFDWTDVLPQTYAAYVQAGDRVGSYAAPVTAVIP